MLGYIKNGKYYKGAWDKITVSAAFSLVKAQDHDDQRFMHQAELVQPYLPDGTVNPEFTELYYEESKNFGYIKETTED